MFRFLCVVLFCFCFCFCFSFFFFFPRSKCSRVHHHVIFVTRESIPWKKLLPVPFSFLFPSSLPSPPHLFLSKKDEKVFHKTCLKCKTCQKTVSLGNYAALNGVFYCKPHFKQLFAAKYCFFFFFFSFFFLLSLSSFFFFFFFFDFFFYFFLCCDSC